MSEIVIFWIYYSICALYEHIYFTFKIKSNKLKEDEEFSSRINELCNMTNLNEEQVISMLHLICILFSWLIVPMSIVKKILKLQK